MLHTEQEQKLTAVISLAGVVDLRAGWDLQLGAGAVGRLIGGSPAQYPERYRQASPVELLPMSLRQVLIQGRDDRIVPISQKRTVRSKSKRGRRSSDPDFHLTESGISS